MRVPAVDPDGEHSSAGVSAYSGSDSNSSGQDGKALMIQKKTGSQVRRASPAEPVSSKRRVMAQSLTKGFSTPCYY